MRWQSVEHAGLQSAEAWLLQYSFAAINGAPGLLRWYGDGVESALSIVTDGERIRAIYVVRNPDKLRHIAASMVTSDQARAS